MAMLASLPSEPNILLAPFLVKISLIIELLLAGFEESAKPKPRKRTEIFGETQGAEAPEVPEASEVPEVPEGPEVLELPPTDLSPSIG